MQKELANSTAYREQASICHFKGQVQFIKSVRYRFLCDISCIYFVMLDVKSLLPIANQHATSWCAGHVRHCTRLGCSIHTSWSWLDAPSRGRHFLLPPGIFPTNHLQLLAPIWGWAWENVIIWAEGCFFLLALMMCNLYTININNYKCTV